MNFNQNLKSKFVGIIRMENLFMQSLYLGNHPQVNVKDRSLRLNSTKLLFEYYQHNDLKITSYRIV